MPVIEGMAYLISPFLILWIPSVLVELCDFLQVEGDVNAAQNY